MSIKSFLIGQPLETRREKHERLTKKIGMAVFASDALSSTAYATEEILLVLVLAGSSLLNYSLPIAISIAALIAIVATSYFQTIHAYPSGGGAYIVAKDNLGVNAGLIAGAALLIDYVLTVAVSIAAGVAALTSAVPALASHRVLICLVAIAILALLNLRGVKESGAIFAAPTYVFIFSIFTLIGVGLFKGLSAPAAAAPTELTAAVDVVPLFILLRAFASGCTALTGIEAISNGVKAFRDPEARNASITLIWMAVILGSLFIGITFLVNRFGIVPSTDGTETVLSQLAGAVFAKGFFYYLIQAATALILILAANTSFADFPRLSSVMAADGYLPRQLSNRGDRLVFSNGVVILGGFAALLVIAFGASTHALIPLYAVGVFLSFTLSQAGMVRHWWREERGRLKGMVINGLGAVTTGVVLVIITGVKFREGAFVIVIAIPVIVYLTKQVKKHYLSVASQLTLEGAAPEVDFRHHSVIVPISGVHQAVVQAVKYARALSDDVVAFYVAFRADEVECVQERWQQFGMGVPLVVVHSPYRTVVEPLLDYIESVQEQHAGGVITVILPEFVPEKWWHHLLHNETAILLKGILLFKRGVVTTSVPLHLKK